MVCLEGLSVGDAFGESCVVEGQAVNPWCYTDDTVMAISVWEELRDNQKIIQDSLAQKFWEKYKRDPFRGYGNMAVIQLSAMSQGQDWREVSRTSFNGEGSKGNGGAMRCGPIGAYFAPNYSQVIENAYLSAEVTHHHPDGKAGAIAISMAVAIACKEKKPPDNFYQIILESLDDCSTKHGIEIAETISSGESPHEVAQLLGNGSRPTAPESVPFCLWCAYRHWNNYQKGLETAVSVGGDMDTNCAMVGAILACVNGMESIPQHWLKAREPLQIIMEQNAANS